MSIQQQDTQGDDDLDTEDTEDNEDTTPADDDAPEPDATDPSKADAKPPGKKTVVMASDVIAQIRREEREKGKRLALKELNTKAMAKGFLSWEDMVEKASTKPSGGDKDAARLRKEREELLEERKQLNQKLAAAEKKARRLEREHQNALTNFELRDLARAAGITDPDYAVELCKRAVAKKTPEEAKTFDQAGFFTGLKKSHPHLFVVEAPAQTSPTTPETPAPNPNLEKPPTKPSVDAKALSQEQYYAHLRARGLSVPGST